MGNLEKEIRLGLERKGMTLAEFISKVGFTEQACYKMFRNNSTTLKRVNQINSILGINLMFETNSETQNIDSANFKQKVQYGSDFESIIERYRNEWNEEKKTLQNRIVILSNTIRDLSLGKFKGIYSPICTF